MRTKRFRRWLPGLSMMLGVVTIVAWTAIEVRNASGQQAGGLTLVPGAPPWAKLASGNLMLRYTYQWRAMREQLRAAAAGAAAAPSKGLIETATVFGAVVFNKDPNALPQNETTIREDPTGGGRIVAGYNDFRALISATGDFSGWSTSTTSAASVAKDGQAQPVTIAGFKGVPSQGDPAMDTDKFGNIFYSSLAFETVLSGGHEHQPNGVVIYRSPNAASGTGLFGSACVGGDADTHCWPTAKLVFGEDSDLTVPSGHINDKDWLAVDRSAGATAGQVYVTWTRFSQAAGGPFSLPTSAIEIAKCNNTLSICTAPVTLDSTAGTANAYDFLQFSYVTVDSAGKVNVVWVKHGSTSTSSFDPKFFTDTIRFRSITPTTTASVGTLGAITTVFVEKMPIVQDTFPFPASYRAFAIPVLAKSGTKINVVWPHRHVGTPAALDGAFFLDSDIVSSISTDGGAHWSAPATVSAAAKAQYMPSICVNNLGQVEVVYYSNQLDTINGFTQDVFLAKSTDGGLTYGTPIRVTATSNNPTNDLVLSGTFIGDYTGVSCAGTNAFVSYTANYAAKSTAPFLDGSASIFVKQQDNFVAKVSNP
jgi:hypothetical protein